MTVKKNGHQSIADIFRVINILFNIGEESCHKIVNRPKDFNDAKKLNF